MIKTKQQAGSVLLAIIIMLPFLILITALYLGFAVSTVNLSRRGQMQTHAQIAADAGIDQGIQQLNQNDSFAGSSETNLQNANNVRTTYQTSIADTGTSQKTLTSTGRAYKGSSTSPAATIKIKVVLRGVSSGASSVVSGVGGLVMLNSSKIVDGSVFVNGTLTMSSTSQIGLSTKPVNVKVAHKSCPLGGGATYPQVCGSGNGQPISISNSAHIYGDVQATNQTNGSGMSNNGLVSGSPAPLDLPDYNRAAQKSAVASTLSGNFSCNSDDVVSWPANYKIAGNVTIQGKCKVTLNGNVWVTGNISLKNSSQMIVASGLTSAPVIMVDGSDGLNMRESSALTSNASKIGFRVIAFYNSTGSPDATPTGNDLYNSRNLITIDSDNTASAPNTEFYARWSKVTAGNSGNLGAVIGQTVELKNSLAITFGTSVTGFGGDTVWVVDSVKRDF